MSVFHVDLGTPVIDKQHAIGLLCAINDIQGVKFAILPGSDWPQMGQIWDFLRSVSVHFDSARQKLLKLILIKSQICPIWGQSDPIWMPNLTSRIPGRLVPDKEIGENLTFFLTRFNDLTGNGFSKEREISF